MVTRALFLLATASVAACKLSFDPFGRPGAKPTVIAGVVVSPRAYALVVGDSARFGAYAYAQSCGFDTCSYSAVPATFIWRSSDTTVLTVSGGLVHALRGGNAAVVATTAGKSDSALIMVGRAYIPLARVAPGEQCAVGADSAAYCWGLYVVPPYIPVAVAPGFRFSAIAAGSALTCGIAVDVHGLCWSGFGGSPALIDANLQFQSLSPGRRNSANADGQHVCGVVLDGTAWCWGADDAGQLGTTAPLSTCYIAEIGHDFPCSATPVPVVGLSSLAAISAGGAHTCALAVDGTAYCWGDNTWGQLGDSSTVSRETPMPVRGVPPLASVVAGTEHTCGVSRSGTAYCWGRNLSGQLAIGSQDSLPHPMPVTIVGNLSIASLDAAFQTCVLTSAGKAYCWGGGVNAPVPVEGNLVFRSIGVAPGPMLIGCGIATSGRGYCWGETRVPGLLDGPISP